MNLDKPKITKSGVECNYYEDVRFSTDIQTGKTIVTRYYWLNKEAHDSGKEPVMGETIEIDTPAMEDFKKAITTAINVKMEAEEQKKLQTETSSQIEEGGEIIDGGQ